MPVDKKQHTTLTPTPTTAESSSPHEVVQQAFHQQLRDHIRGAVRLVMEEIMREELTQFLGAQWGVKYPKYSTLKHGQIRESLELVDFSKLMR
jgi:putative transposase